MKTWQEVKESPNYRRLKDSLELRVAKRNALIFGIITLVYGTVSVAAMSAVSAASSSKSITGAVLLVIMTLMLFIPATGFYLYRIFKIFHHIDDYAFTEVVLDKPRGGMGRGMMYFDITVRDRFGGEIATQTHELFTSSAEGLATLEEYTNKKVLIGYNHVTEFVAVIG